MTHFYRRLTLVLASAAVITGCNNNDEREAKTENSAVWASYASGSYEYDIVELCSCPNPEGFHTIVIDGEVFSTTAIGPRLGSNTIKAVTTIQQLFDIAGQEGVTTTYNAQYGYPEKVGITAKDLSSQPSPESPSFEYPTVKDSTAGFEVKNFVLIESF